MCIRIPSSSHSSLPHNLQLILFPPSTSLSSLLVLRRLVLRTLHIFIPHLLLRVPWFIALLQYRPVTPSNRSLVFLLPRLPELWMIRHLFLLLLLLILLCHLADLLRV